MQIAILTFDGYNELDSLIALGILHRVTIPDWHIAIASPTPYVTSMNGVVIKRHIDLSEAATADAVIIGSGMHTRTIIEDTEIMSQLTLNPSRQLIASQCSGGLLLATLGLLDNMPVCTDLTTSPWLQEKNVEVLSQAFFAKGNIASAGGCLASQYLAAWLIARLAGMTEMKQAIHYVAPVGEKEPYIQHTRDVITPYL